MSVKDQQALDRLYAIDNVLTIEITMPQPDWDAVRTEKPAGGNASVFVGNEVPRPLDRFLEPGGLEWL